MYSPMYRCKYNYSTVLCGVKHLAHGQLVTTEGNKDVQIFNLDLSNYTQQRACFSNFTTLGKYSKGLHKIRCLLSVKGILTNLSSYVTLIGGRGFL